MGGVESNSLNQILESSNIENEENDQIKKLFGTLHIMIKEKFENRIQVQKLLQYT